MQNETTRVGHQPALIPITVIGGFLGAGKTTLLNHILSSDHGLRVAALVNDFGAINIDAKLVVGVEGDTVELANGCVCCTIREDLAGACLELLKRPEPPEHLFVELSGVSDPVPVVNTFQDMELSTPFRFSSILAVADSEQLPRMDGEMAALAHSQLGSADIIVLNKVDLVSNQELEKVKEIVKVLTHGAKMVEAVQGKIPLELILSGIDLEDISKRTIKDSHSHNHQKGHGLGTWSWTSEQPLSLPKLREVISQLPETIYRCKGIVCLEELPMYKYIVQMVGKRFVITEDKFWGEEEARSEIVLIGGEKDIHPEEFETRFDSCIGIGDESQSAVLRLARKLNYTK